MRLVWNSSGAPVLDPLYRKKTVELQHETETIDVCVNEQYFLCTHKYLIFCHITDT